MRQIHPTYADDVDPTQLYAADDRRRAPAGRPWVLMNMIASADGATAVDGRSGPLGGPTDKRVFSALRGVADVILVGAGTLRAEGYGPPRGRARLAVCTASLALDPAARLFAEAEPERRPLVFTVASAPADRRAALEPVAEIIDAGATSVDLAAVLAELGRRDVSVVLCEGGPSLNGQLVSAGLVDEVCLTVAPLLVGGEAARVAHGDPPALPARLRLDRILEGDGMLFLRYVVDRT